MQNVFFSVKENFRGAFRHEKQPGNLEIWQIGINPVEHNIPHFWLHGVNYLPGMDKPFLLRNPAEKGTGAGAVLWLGPPRKCW